MLHKLETTKKALPVRPLAIAIRRAAGRAVAAMKRRHASKAAQRHLAQQPNHILEDIGLARWEIRIATRTITTSRYGWRSASGQSQKALPAAHAAGPR